MSHETRFREALELIGMGDVAGLRRHLTEHPAAGTQRLSEAGSWLRDKIGGALDGFFKAPFLLWFVAEDVPFFGTMPANIEESTRAIIAAIRNSENFREQLDSTLELVCYSPEAGKSDVQIKLLDVLIEAGACPDNGPNCALINGHVASARHLIARGAKHTLASAVCLADWSEAERLASLADSGERQFALVLAALRGRAASLKFLLVSGADPNSPSVDLYSHGTPLHHAVCSGNIEAVEVLVQAGADASKVDTVWKGTPLDWAEHYLGERKDADSQKRFGEIANLLRNL